MDEIQEDKPVKRTRRVSSTAASAKTEAKTEVKTEAKTEDSKPAEAKADTGEAKAPAARARKTSKPAQHQLWRHPQVRRKHPRFLARVCANRRIQLLGKPSEDRMQQELRRPGSPRRRHDTGGRQKVGA